MQASITKHDATQIQVDGNREIEHQRAAELARQGNTEGAKLTWTCPWCHDDLERIDNGLELIVYCTACMFSETMYRTETCIDEGYSPEEW